jgi:hypothetical protein
MMRIPGEVTRTVAGGEDVRVIVVLGLRERQRQPRESWGPPKAERAGPGRLMRFLMAGAFKSSSESRYRSRFAGAGHSVWITSRVTVDVVTVLCSSADYRYEIG